MSDLTSLKVTQLLQIILPVKISKKMIKELFNIERWEYTRTIVFELFVRAFENGTDIYLKNRLVFKWHFNKTLCFSNKEIWMLQWFQVRRGIAISDIVLCVKCEWKPCLARSIHTIWLLSVLCICHVSHFIILKPEFFNA